MGKVLVIKGADFSTNKIDTIVIGNQVNITINNTGSGSGSVDGSGAHSEGAEVTLFAKPSNNNIFAGWADLNGDEKYNPIRTVTASTDMLFSCAFEPITAYKGYANYLNSSTKCCLTVYNNNSDAEKRARTTQLYGRYTIECNTGYKLRAVTFYKPSTDVEDANNQNIEVTRTWGSQGTTMQGQSSVTLGDTHSEDFSIVIFQKDNANDQITSSEYGDIIKSITYLN